MSLTPSKDRKVANAVNKSGKTATIANAFGLPAGLSYACPGATSFCERICYAGALEKAYRNVKKVLVHNFQELLYADYLDGVEGMTFLIQEMITAFEKECDKRGAEKKFRIHWDGDFFSTDYAEAWARVIKSSPDTQFWAYTRSFTAEVNVLPILSGIENLTLYLSGDPVNIALANEQAARHEGTYIATVADTFAEARETLVDASRKTYPCPENAKRIALISEKGSACFRCGICVEGRGDVLFARLKR